MNEEVEETRVCCVCSKVVYYDENVWPGLNPLIEITFGCETYNKGGKKALVHSCSCWPAIFDEYLTELRKKNKSKQPVGMA